MNNIIQALLTIGRSQNILKIFGRRKRNNRGMIWASLLGLGISAAAFGIGRNRNSMIGPVKNVMNSIRFRPAGQMPKTVDITEFSKELVPDKNLFTTK